MPDTAQAVPRIWMLYCPFRRNGSPVVGAFGATEKPVVIMTVDTWDRLIRTVPATATRSRGKE